jgi:hypothetical protein
MSIFRRLGRSSKEFVQVRGSSAFFRDMLVFTERGFLAPHSNTQRTSWRTIRCSLSTAAYSTYSQLPSIAGGRPSIGNPRTRHAVLTRNPPNMVKRSTKTERVVFFLSSPRK